MPFSGPDTIVLRCGLGQWSQRGAVGVINSHTETRGSLLLFYVLCFHKLSSPLSVAAAPGPAEG